MPSAFDSRPFALIRGSAFVYPAQKRPLRALLRQPRTRRRHLIALGIGPGEVMKASRCHRGYWWMNGNGIVQRALNDAWLREQMVPDLKTQWIELHYGNRNSN